MKDLTREQLEAFYADSLDINATLRGENERLKKHVNDYAQAIESLKAERNAFEAKLSRINCAWLEAGCWPDTIEEKKRISDAIVSDPRHCLRHIKAEVVEKYYYMGWEHSLSTKADNGDHYGCGKSLAKQFAESVRKGGE